jgi:hypothetical protein
MGCALYIRCALFIHQKECRKIWGALYTSVRVIHRKIRHLGLHNKPKAAVLAGAFMLTGPKRRWRTRRRRGRRRIAIFGLNLLGDEPSSHFSYEHNYINIRSRLVGRDSSVGIATRYGLDGPGTNSGDGEIFRTRPDRRWGPPSLQFCYRIGTGSFRE